MANLPTQTREEIVDMVEELVIMGFKKSHQIWKILQKKGVAISDYRTVVRYMSIVRRRMRKIYGKRNLEEMLKKELRDIDYMEQQSWINYQASQAGPERSLAMATLNKIKERRAKLLGLDTETLLLGKKEKTLEDLIREDDEKEEQTIDRGIILDSGQARQPGEIQIESSAKQIGSGMDAEGSDIKSEAKGS